MSTIQRGEKDKMPLYDLKQEDIADIHSLICAASLTITANNARRVAQLQVMLASAKPSDLLKDCETRCEMLERQVQECLRARDAAQLESGIAKRALDEMAARLGALDEMAARLDTVSGEHIQQ